MTIILFPPGGGIHRKSPLSPFTVTDTIEWENGRIDIAPEYIYEHGKAA